MFLCTLTGHLLIKEQWKTCIVWEVLQETLNCLLNLWNHFSHLTPPPFFFKGMTRIFSEGFLHVTWSPFSSLFCIARFKSDATNQKLWHTQIHSVLVRVNDKRNRFYPFLQRNQTARQLSNMLIAWTTTTAPLNIQQTAGMRRETTSSQQGCSWAGSSPSLAPAKSAICFLAVFNNVFFCCFWGQRDHRVSHFQIKSESFTSGFFLLA